MTKQWPTNDRERARNHVGCNVTTCPNGKCRATGECIDVRYPNATTIAALEESERGGGEIVYSFDELIAGITPDNLHPEIPVSPPLAPHDDEVNPKTLMGARRVDLSLLPAAGIIHGAHAMMDGAAKYGPYNWREKKVPARTYIAAAMRHLVDFLDGEETAADSQVHHLGHVIGCCAIVLDAMETGNLIDDRPKAGAAPAILARLEQVIRARQQS